MELLNSFDVFFIGLHCPLPELEKRERARGDRQVGEAKRDFTIIHDFPAYDLEVDSTAPLGTNVTEVISAWKARRKPSAFDDMTRERKADSA